MIPGMRTKIIGVLLSLAACSSPDLTAPQDAGDGLDANTPPDLRVDVPYHLDPGQEVRYLCRSVRVPDPAPEVVEIAPVYGPGVHHVVVWSPLQTEPDGEFPCPQLAKSTWVPLYTGGIASTPLVAPPDTAFRLVAGQQVVVQLHLLNASMSPVSGQASVVMKVAAEHRPVAAGFWGADDRAFSVPAGAVGYEVTQTCALPWGIDAFALFGHMHQLGKKFELFRGPVAGQGLVYAAPWKFDDQPVVPVDLKLQAGEQVTVRCTYDNPSPTDVPYGESSNQEMCSLAVFYTPYKGFAGCIKTVP